MAELPAELAWAALDFTNQPIACIDAATGEHIWKNCAYEALAALSSAPDDAAAETRSLECAGRHFLVLKFPLASHSPVEVPRDARPDSLTGLVGRHEMWQALEQAFAGADRSPFALLFIDLDGFKQVNDRLGHLGGDRVLQEVAARLASAIRKDDLLARYGGDEFVAILRGVKLAPEIQPIVSRIEQALAAGDPTPPISASMGAAFSTDGHDSPNALLQAADRAMYEAKLQK